MVINRPERTLRLRREQRLLKATQFELVFKRGQRLSDRYFTVLILQKPESCARLGLAISKKSVKLSASRNRLKRLIRECFRLNQHALGAVDIVVMCRPGAGSLPNRFVHKSILGLFKNSLANPDLLQRQSNEAVTNSSL